MFKKILSFITLITLSMPMYAQEDIAYQKPSKEILDLADFELAPAISMNSSKDQAILVYRNTYKTLDDLNQEEMHLGGLRINPRTSISSTISFYIIYAYVCTRRHCLSKAFQRNIGFGRF